MVEFTCGDPLECTLPIVVYFIQENYCFIKTSPHNSPSFKCGREIREVRLWIKPMASSYFVRIEESNLIIVSGNSILIRNFPLPIQTDCKKLLFVYHVPIFFTLFPNTQCFLDQQSIFWMILALTFYPEIFCLFNVLQETIMILILIFTVFVTLSFSHPDEIYYQYCRAVYRIITQIHQQWNYCCYVENLFVEIKCFKTLC